LKEIGFSLHDVQSLLDNNLSLDEMKAMLTRRQKDLENEIAIAQLNLNTVLSRIKSIENEGIIPKYDITVKSTTSFMIVSSRQIIPHIKDIGTYCYNLYSELYTELNRMNIIGLGNEITFYHCEEYNETDLDIEFGIMIDPNDTVAKKISSSRLVLNTIASEDKVASLIYNGPFEDLEFAFIELIKWIALNSWDIAGAGRELHLSGPAHSDGKVQQNAIIELQIPIKAASI
jgi:effector-binding domain-containing protein